MSPARGGDRRRLGGRGHLVLLRGGLDRAEPQDADWQAFCARIGWQEASGPLADDYEERLIERVLAGDTRRDSPLRGDVERARGAAQIVGGPDEGWRFAGAANPWQPRARRASLTAATVAVAAFVCAAACVMIWQAARPPVSATACPDVEASPRATIAPVDDRVAPVETREPWSSSRRTKDVPPSPAPSEAKPRPPRPPGTLIARRTRGDATRPHAASRSAASPTRVGGTFAPAVRRAEPAAPLDLHDDAAAIGSADFQAMAPRLGLLGARPRSVVLPASPVIPRDFADGRASEAWMRPASFGQGVVPASATWSLSPESSRWYGVGLPPSSASGVPTGVGVLGQLDVVKAIQRL